MSTRMLIDARHEEETRVTVVKGNRIEEFDYESSAKRQLKGNIYLAKVTRVEPSLQAAFVEYGGNRQGFLAFNEIHPDYYQLPMADREALLAEEQAEAREEADDESADTKSDNGEENGDEVETVADDTDPQERRRPAAHKKRYKIQEVIKKRQILLIQVVKEERGSKGAALTTYISLAGRYCVLMPNSQSDGGISRKIANIADRKRLKSIVEALKVPNGMGCIIRTAGLSRTKAEIKRDFDYLLRLWDEIRELTLKSVAPCLIHEEANLIKRSIRDLYTRDIDEVLVEGDSGYRTAKDFMRMLMPSHARKVKHYRDDIPLFHRYQVEQQLESMYNPEVELRSGGYVVINPTEALVAIDVNSGKSTKEHNVEETALKTNLEAADEVARQLRLRDMAGLVVIDFIDMEDRGNNRAVEKRIKDALKTDRARVQVGRISSFGLMEMSRQRLRPNLIEASTVTCPNCKGTGTTRSIESQAIRILRRLEEEGIRDRSGEAIVHAPADVVAYLFNRKRKALGELEQRYGLQVSVYAQPGEDGEGFLMERLPKDADPGATPQVVTQEVVGSDRAAPPPETPAAKTRENNRDNNNSRDRHTGEAGGDDDGGKKKRRRRRRKKRPEGEQAPVDANTANQSDAPQAGVSGEASSDAATSSGDEKPTRRRGGRRRKPQRDAATTDTGQEATAEVGQSETTPPPDNAEADTSAGGPTSEATESETKPKRPRRRRPAKAENTDAADGLDGGEPATASASQDEPPARPRRRRKPKAVPTDAANGADTPQDKATVTAAPPSPASETAPAPSLALETSEPGTSKGVERQRISADGDAQGSPAISTDNDADKKPKRKGWWQRISGS